MGRGDLYVVWGKVNKFVDLKSPIKAADKAGGF